MTRTFRAAASAFRRGRETIWAVRDLSLRIRCGEVFGILGPNGAGKTTTIKVLTTLLLPTSGSAHVLGLDVTRSVREVRQSIGYAFGGDRGFYDRISALDNLRYFADLYGVSPRQRQRRIEELLELVGLLGRETERVQGFSRGMRQRLHIARALLHDPQVVFLDEPTLGVDPVGARQLRALVRDLNEHGKTILLTTHYMFEAEELCQRIAVVAAGRLVALGSPAELIRRVSDKHVVEIGAHGIDAEHLRRISALAGVQSVHVQDAQEPQTLLVTTASGVDVTDRITACLGGARIVRVSAREPSLEDAYVALVGAQP